MLHRQRRAADNLGALNRAEIMKSAWILYRRDTRLRRPCTSADRRAWFARSLTTAWSWAHQRTANIRKPADHHRAEKIAALNLELKRIDARSFRMPTANDRATILAEIDSLSTPPPISLPRS